MTYLKYLDSLRASESFRSVWIFAESSHKIFDFAKKRVFRFGRLDGGKYVGQSKTATTKKRKLENSNREKQGEFFLVMVFSWGSICLVLASAAHKVIFECWGSQMLFSLVLKLLFNYITYYILHLFKFYLQHSQ